MVAGSAIVLLKPVNGANSFLLLERHVIFEAALLLKFPSKTLRTSSNAWT
jgi:hypothetical protein